MTILEAVGQLYTWYIENDSFNMEEDFTKIIVVTDHPNRDRAAFSQALEDLREAHMVNDREIGGKVYWVLKKPFSAFSQTIDISPDLAVTVAGIVNKFCDMTDNNTDICDPLNITEGDFRKVIYIANLMLQKDIDEEEE